MPRPVVQAAHGTMPEIMQQAWEEHIPYIAQWTLDPERAPNRVLAEETLARLGLGPHAKIHVTPILHPPDPEQGWDPTTMRNHAGRIELEIEVTDRVFDRSDSGEFIARDESSGPIRTGNLTRIGADGNTQEILFPWPVPGTGNVFAANGMEYTIRTELHPLPGLYLSEFHDPERTLDPDDTRLITREIAYLDRTGMQNLRWVLTGGPGREPELRYRHQIRNPSPRQRLTRNFRSANNEGFVPNPKRPNFLDPIRNEARKYQNPEFNLWNLNPQAVQVLTRVLNLPEDHPELARGKIGPEIMGLLLEHLNEEEPWAPRYAINALNNQRFWLPAHTLGLGLGQSLKRLCEEAIGMGDPVTTAPILAQIARDVHDPQRPRLNARLVAENLANRFANLPAAGNLHQAIREWSENSRRVTITVNAGIREPEGMVQNQNAHGIYANVVVPKARRAANQSQDRAESILPDPGETAIGPYELGFASKSTKGASRGASAQFSRAAAAEVKPPTTPNAVPVTLPALRLRNRDQNPVILSIQDLVESRNPIRFGDQVDDQDAPVLWQNEIIDLPPGMLPPELALIPEEAHDLHTIARPYATLTGAQRAAAASHMEKAKVRARPSETTVLELIDPEGNPVRIPVAEQNRICITARQNPEEQNPQAPAIWQGEIVPIVTVPESVPVYTIPPEYDPENILGNTPNLTPLTRVTFANPNDIPINGFAESLHQVVDRFDHRLSKRETDTGIALRAVILDGGAGSFEDSLEVRKGAVDMLDAAFPVQVRLERSLTEDPAVEAIGPGCTALQDNTLIEDPAYLQQMLDEAGITLEGWKNLGPDGIIKPGSYVREGDPLRLRRLETDPDPVLGTRHRWMVDRVPTQGHGGQVLRIQFGNASTRADQDQDMPNTNTSTETEQEIDTDAAPTLEPGEDISVHLRVLRPPGMGTKYTTLNGGKGMICRERPDEEMPHDAEGRPADIILSAYSLLQRKIVGEYLQAEDGAAFEMAITNIPRLLERVLEDPEQNPKNHPDWAELVQRASVMTWEFRDEENSGLLSMNPCRDPNDPEKILNLGDVLTQADRTALEEIHKRMAHERRPRCDSVWKILHRADRPLESHRENLLAQGIDPEKQNLSPARNGLYVNREAFLQGIPYEQPAIHAPMSLNLLVNLAGGQHNNLPTARETSNRNTGQPDQSGSNAPKRMGLLEWFAMISGTNRPVLDEFASKADPRTREGGNLQRTIGLIPSAKAPSFGDSETDAHLDKLLIAGNLYRDHGNHGRILPLGDERARALSRGRIQIPPEANATLPESFDSHGERVEGSLHDPKIFGNGHDSTCTKCSPTVRLDEGLAGTCPGCGAALDPETRQRSYMGHIELPVAVVHPYTPSWIRELTGLDARTWDSCAMGRDPINTNGLPGGPTGNIWSVAVPDLLTDRTQLPRVVRAGPGHQEGPDALQEALTRIRDQVRDHGDEILAKAKAEIQENQNYINNNKDLSTTKKNRQQQYINTLQNRLKALTRLHEELRRNPDSNPGDWISHTLVVPPSHMRAGHTVTGDLAHMQDDLDRNYNRILHTAHTIEQESRFPHDPSGAITRRPVDATARMSFEVRNLMEQIQVMTAGKRGAIARTTLGYQITSSMRASIAPGTPDTGPLHADIPYQDGILLVEPEVRFTLTNLLGYDEQQVNEEIRTFGPMARQAAQSALTGMCGILNRGPTIHPHSMIAVGLHLTDRGNQVSTIRIPPVMNQAFNADFDGDAMSLSLLENTTAILHALDGMGPAERLLRKKGDGSILAKPRHAARSGILKALNQVPENPNHSPLEGLLVRMENFLNEHCPRGIRGTRIRSKIENQISEDHEISQALHNTPRGEIRGPWLETLEEAIMRVSEQEPRNFPDCLDAVHAMSALTWTGFDVCDPIDREKLNRDLRDPQKQAFLQKNLVSASIGPDHIRALQRELRALVEEDKQQNPQNSVFLFPKGVRPLDPQQGEIWAQQAAARTRKAIQLLTSDRLWKHQDPMIRDALTSIEQSDRLSWDVLVQIILEVGVSVDINQQLGRTYLEESLLEVNSNARGYSAFMQLANLANHSNENEIGLYGALMQRLANMSAKMVITRNDCGITRNLDLTKALRKDARLLRKTARSWKVHYSDLDPDQEPLPALEEGKILDLNPAHEAGFHLQLNLLRQAQEDPNTKNKIQLVPVFPTQSIQPDTKDPKDHRHLEGLVLAQANEDQNLPEGHVLTAKDLSRLHKSAQETGKEIQLAVRAPWDCANNDGICRTCAGSTRRDGLAPRIGDFIGIEAAMSVAEKQTQQILNAARMARTGQSSMEKLPQRLDRTLKEECAWIQNPDPDKEIQPPAWEDENLREARLAFRKAVLAHDPWQIQIQMARMLQEIDIACDLHPASFPHFRVLATALCEGCEKPDWAGPDHYALARKNDPAGATNTRSSYQAFRRLIEDKIASVRRLGEDPHENRPNRKTRKASLAEGELVFTPLLHQHVLRNDLKQAAQEIQKLRQEQPDLDFHDLTDGLDHHPLYLVQSPEMAKLLIEEAGLDPYRKDVCSVSALAHIACRGTSPQATQELNHPLPLLHKSRTILEIERVASLHRLSQNTQNTQKNHAAHIPSFERKLIQGAHRVLETFTNPQTREITYGVNPGSPSQQSQQSQQQAA